MEKVPVNFRGESYRLSADASPLAYTTIRARGIVSSFFTNTRNGDVLTRYLAAAAAAAAIDGSLYMEVGLERGDQLPSWSDRSISGVLEGWSRRGKLMD